MKTTLIQYAEEMAGIVKGKVAYVSPRIAIVEYEENGKTESISLAGPELQRTWRHWNKTLIAKVKGIVETNALFSK